MRFAWIIALLSVPACARLVDRPHPDGPPPATSDGGRGEGRLVDVASRLDQPSPGGAIKLSGFRADWASPTQIFWSWKAEADPAQFKSYQLVTARTAADVLARTGSAVVWSAAQSPELGRWYRTPTEQVLSSITGGHSPGTTTFAQLVATDSSNRTSTSAVASIDTPAQAGGAIVVFSESDTAGYSIPDTFKLTTGSNSYSGTHYYEYLANCPAGQPTCWENLRRQDIKLSTAALPAAAFATAFFELAVSCEGETSWWTDLWLRFGAADTGPLWHFQGWTLPCDGKYRRYQIPLRVFGDNKGGFLQHPEASTVLYEFNAVGGAWSAGARVRADELGIRW